MKINQVISEDITKPITKDDIENVFFGNLKKSSEADTQIETELYNIIHQYIRSSTHFKKRKLADALKFLKGIKNDYPNDLIPKAKIAYRGTAVNDEAYEKVKNHGKRRKRWVFNWLEVDFTYKPQNELQSWTTDFRTARTFAILQSNFFKQRPAIIQAKVDDDFILTAKITNLIFKLYSKGEEHEIFRVSNQPIKGTLIVDSNWIKKWEQK